MIDYWLIDWFVDWLIGWLIDQEIDRYASENVNKLLVGNKCDLTNKKVNSRMGKIGDPPPGSIFYLSLYPGLFRFISSKWAKYINYVPGASISLIFPPFIQRSSSGCVVWKSPLNLALQNFKLNAIIHQCILFATIPLFKIQSFRAFRRLLFF